MTQFNLSDRGLEYIPDSVFEFSNEVTSLNLANNQLKDLPPKISQLTNLRNLDLSSNQLTIIPPEVRLLTKLTELQLPFNNLTSLPIEITKLVNLENLILIGNNLDKIPDKIWHMPNLELLFLAYNPEVSLPFPASTVALPSSLLFREKQIKRVSRLMKGYDDLHLKSDLEFVGNWAITGETDMEIIKNFVAKLNTIVDCQLIESFRHELMDLVKYDVVLGSDLGFLIRFTYYEDSDCVYKSGSMQIKAYRTTTCSLWDDIKIVLEAQYRISKALTSEA